MVENFQLDRTFKALINTWGAGHAADVRQGVAEESSEEVWEARLKKQNAANDELCSANCKLRGEIDRLRLEEQLLEDSVASASPTSVGSADSAEQALLGQLHAKVHSIVTSFCREVQGSAETLSETTAAAGEDDSAPPQPREADPNISEDRADAGDPEAPPCAADALTDFSGPALPVGFMAPANPQDDGVANSAEGSVEPSLQEKEAATFSAGAPCCEGGEEALEGNGRDEGAPDVAVRSPRASFHGLPKGGPSQRADARMPEGSGSSRTGAPQDASALAEGIVALVLQAVSDAFAELDASDSDAAMLRLQETALLVEQKLALRELVQEQQERIELLENELHAVGAVVPMGSSMSSIPESVVRSISDVRGALRAGVSAALAQPALPPKAGPPKSAVVVGAEYEIISNLGAIVRRGDSLKSGQVAELASGSRVKVMAISERHPRRVEVVFVGAGAEPEAAQCPMDRRPSEESAPASDPPEAQDVPDGPVADPGGGGVQGPVVGWISASAQDGRPLIRPVARELPADGSAREADKEQARREESNTVTLSRAEWEGIGRAQVAGARRTDALSCQLSEMGRELAQAFEMKSVLRELRGSVARAAEREASLRALVEAAATALEGQSEARRSAPAHAAAGSGTAAVESEAPATSAPVAASEQAMPEACCTAEAGVEQPRGLSDLDRDRLLSERETTALALSAGLQRLASLERERSDFERDAQSADTAFRRELAHIRAKLRRLTSGPATSSAGAASSSSGGVQPQRGPGAAAEQQAQGVLGSTVAENLFLRRVEDLQHTVGQLEAELRRSAASEAALQVSVSARTSALRRVLRAVALSSARSSQRGSFLLQARSERDALRIAVEEQLQLNLQLRMAGLGPPTFAEAQP